MLTSLPTPRLDESAIMLGGARSCLRPPAKDATNAPPIGLEDEEDGTAEWGRQDEHKVTTGTLITFGSAIVLVAGLILWSDPDGLGQGFVLRLTGDEAVGVSGPGLS